MIFPRMIDVSPEDVSFVSGLAQVGHLKLIFLSHLVGVESMTGETVTIERLELHCFRDCS